MTPLRAAAMELGGSNERKMICSAAWKQRSRYGAERGIRAVDEQFTKYNILGLRSGKCALLVNIITQFYT